MQAGDATDMAPMEAAITGQDAVIDTAGGKTPCKHTTLEASLATTIVAAMQQQDVRRLVVTSMVDGGDSAANAPSYVKILLANFMRGATPDKAKMEATVSGSQLD